MPEVNCLSEQPTFCDCYQLDGGPIGETMPTSCRQRDRGYLSGVDYKTEQSTSVKTD